MNSFRETCASAEQKVCVGGNWWLRPQNCRHSYASYASKLARNWRSATHENVVIVTVTKALRAVLYWRLGRSIHPTTQQTTTWSALATALLVIAFCLIMDLIPSSVGTILGLLLSLKLIDCSISSVYWLRFLLWTSQHLIAIIAYRKFCWMTPYPKLIGW